MKRIIFLATVLLFAGSVNAQTYFNGDRADYNPYYQSKWGFEMEANLSNVSPGANFNTSHLAGFSAGFNVDLPVAYPISLMPALLFSQKGYNATTPAGEYSQRIQAIELPFLARFQSSRTVSFYLGPQVSYIISATNKYSGDFQESVRQYYEYGGANLRYQGVIGASVEVARSLNIHARYSFDLAGTGANGFASYVPTYRSHVFQLGFGVNL